MSRSNSTDVVIVGGGVAGRSAAIFTARHGLDTVVIDEGSALLRRNAHLENYPGFPGGIDARLLLELMAEQAERAGTAWIKGSVDRLDTTDGGFEVHTDDQTIAASYVVAATKNTTDYLEHLDDITIIERGSKRFVDADRRGRTEIEDLYAAGRLSLVPHQTVVCAGHGATVGLTILEDSDTPFYQDWVAPDGYFTGRGREVPPGCEEIDDAERRRREADGRELLLDRLTDPKLEPPEQHPSVND